MEERKVQTVGSEAPPCILEGKADRGGDHQGAKSVKWRWNGRVAGHGALGPAPEGSYELDHLHLTGEATNYNITNKVKPLRGF